MTPESLFPLPHYFQNIKPLLWIFWKLSGNQKIPTLPTSLYTLILLYIGLHDLQNFTVHSTPYYGMLTITLINQHWCPIQDPLFDVSHVIMWHLELEYICTVDYQTKIISLPL